MRARAKQNKAVGETSSGSSLSAPETRTDGALAGGDDALAALLSAGRKRTRLRRILALTTGALIVAGAVFLGFKWTAVRDRAAAPRYVTAEVTKGDLKSTISATGTVEALNTVEVGAEISGRITALNADFNDGVEEGQVLAVIDPEQLKASLDQAKAQVLAAEAKVAEAEATLAEADQEAARTEGLADKGLAAPKALESARAAALRAKAALKSAKASAALAKATFDAARSKLSKTEVFSPISGTVLSREVEVGQTLNAGMQTPVLFVIAEDLRRMRISSRVDEADIGAVVPGLKATFTVDAYPERQFASAVTAVRNVPQVEQNVVSYEVLLSVDNQAMLLKPGMTASVEIVTAKHTDVMLVPNKALRFSPPTEGIGMRFRGPPMPFLGSRGGGKSGNKASKTADLGKVNAGQGVVWVLSSGKLPGTRDPRPVKVRRIATDGVQTAIQSKDLNPGDAVIVDQADGDQEKP